MVQRIIFFLLITSNLFSQANAVKLKTNLERCRIDGDYIENCWITTDVNGKAKYITGEEAAIILSSAEAGAVDSIYSSNDTLYVVYFDAPTLAYKASILNGIYSVANNNAQMKVNTINYPTTAFGVVTLQQSNGTNKVQFNNACPLTLYSEASAGIAESHYGNVGNFCLTRIASGLPSSKPSWDYGIINGSQFIIRCNKNQTKNLLAIDTVLTSAITNTLRIYGNGDIGMANYGSARTKSTGVNSVAFWDASGVLQMSSLSVLKDSLDIGALDTKTLSFGATTFLYKSGVMTITGDGAGNTLSTITVPNTSVQTLTLIFADSNITITDDATGSANTINLSSSFTSTANDVLVLVYNGTSWREVSRSIN